MSGYHLKHSMESPITSATVYIQDNRHGASTRHKNIFREVATESLENTCRKCQNTVVNLQAVLGTATALWNVEVENPQLYCSSSSAYEAPYTLIAIGTVYSYWIRESRWAKWCASF